PGGGVIGGTIPGIPLVISGRNAGLGWGVTSSYMDDQDVYIERLNPDNPSEYLTPEGYKPFRTESTIIRISDHDPVTLTLRWTENGPVLPGSRFDLAEVTPPGHVASVAWTALSAHDTTMTAAMALMRARSVAEALEAGRFFVAPSQNLVLADSETIAMKMIGAMPRRDAGHETRGRMPSRGWIAENRWPAMTPYAANPEFVAPRGGLLGNTNNKVVDRPFPAHVSYTWGDTQRVHRWQRLMQARQVHTRDSFVEAQLDTVSFTARALLPLIGKDLWFTGEAAPAGTPERQRQRALDLLSAWNGEMNEHLPEPLLYAAWMRALMDRLIRDELGPVADEFTHPDPVFLERVFRDIEGAAAWCDIRQSGDRETCTDIARLALDDALVWVDEHYGPALESLRWGDVHQATHDHPVLGAVPVLRYFVNIRQSTSGGDNTLMRGRTSGTEPQPFLNVHGAGYRGVYDFADPDSSVFVTSTGQSGHFLSRHYDDLARLWRRGEYIPMSLDPDLARAAAVGVTVLEPRVSD
ncbi:MAG: penicillin acylase family protein, partial [Roseovarius sp.]|nr:penicillin acylase family protein [Roseovarius sp.]